MIFALGLFVVPKQIFFAQSAQMSCCQTEKTETSGCHSDQQEQSCHDTQDQNCTTNCTSCGACHFTVAYFYGHPTTHINSEIRNISSAAEFTYITPDISDILSKIWQPPKIG
ncbi:hypothetical protein [Chryseobacterium sp. MFBS3-17]|uniref:hypothetical protein n=1 Tax=Chryseobacterium sp. MFBS3-17 TaxID=2886689 RepID=UPI001D0F2B9B|nr:hypothetical protein [Chryseobacterium sp. MFBS3-17]MCC2590537.1 hypothetical protein [Chryseobacterium sp. MFBS3-17]